MGKFLQNIAALLGFIAFISAIPLFASMAQLQPPWPPAVASLSSIVLLVSAVVAWEWTRRSKLGLRRGWMITSLVVMVLSLFGYLALNSYFVENAPGSDLRVVRGYECTKMALEVYDSCPDLPREALEDAGWESVKLWTRTSVTNVRLLLVLAWFAFVGGLIGILGAVIAGRNVGNIEFFKAIGSVLKRDSDDAPSESGGDQA